MSETQTATTNANGLVSIEIGNGTVVSGDFATIDWGNGPYFIKTETDPTSGTAYTITGTSQLLSVPYALHAKTAETITGEIIETDPRVPTGTQTGEMLYWNGTEWVTIAAGTEGQMISFVGGIPKWTTVVGPTDVYNPTTGEIWMDRNLGALQVATSNTDADAYGDLYQWGRATDGHEKRTSITTSTLSSTDDPGHEDFITNIVGPYDWHSTQNDDLWQGISGTNNPCPNGYRLPTEAEWIAEFTSWGSNNAAGAFGSPLKVPSSGYRGNINGLIIDVGSAGGYWSSTVSGTYSRFLFFYDSDAYMFSNPRAFGYSVRCLKD